MVTVKKDISDLKQSQYQPNAGKTARIRYFITINYVTRLYDVFREKASYPADSAKEWQSFRMKLEIPLNDDMESSNNWFQDLKDKQIQILDQVTNTTGHNTTLLGPSKVQLSMER